MVDVTWFGHACFMLTAVKSLIGPVDILFLPVGGFYTVGHQEAREVSYQKEELIPCQGSVFYPRSQ